MKRLAIITLSLMAMVGCASTPESAPESVNTSSVTIKSLSADAVQVTWSYDNPDAESVGLVGDFQGWNLAGALPYTKDAKGTWKITLDATPASRFVYKLNVDGEWTEDPLAPATTDDGFGGLNGVVDVPELMGK